jgi:rSAM/selenodomain-associated transferase 1
MSVLSKTALLVFVKYPEPGEVKTRLAAGIGNEKAAAVYRLFAEICLKRYRSVRDTDCIVYCTPAEEKERTAAWLGDEYLYGIQSSGDLGQRLINGFHDYLADYDKVIALGTDSPNLPVAYVEEALASLEDHDAVVGPCDDGGYYLIGMKQEYPFLFEGIEWSTKHVLYQTLMKAKEHHVLIDILPNWYDVDTEDELHKLLKCDKEFIPQLKHILDS